MKNLGKRILIVSLMACLLILGNFYFSNTSQAETSAQADAGQSAGKYVYLSDMPRMSKSYTRYGTILSDTTSSNTKISVKIGGTTTEFDKGIWAHATSDLYYDLHNYQEYDYFYAYLGLNTTSNGGNGVTFSIYTSEDGENWTEKARTIKLAGVNADEVRVNIKGAKYLRLYAYDNGANGKDHSVYADAKLMTADYSDGTGIPTIFDLDDKLKSINESDPEFEYTVLQREFISRIGRNTLVSFINEGEANKETLQWLMGDAETLGMYFYGSTPYGGYKASLNVLSRLYQSYKADLADTAVVRENVRNCDLYKKMIMAIAHTHSTKVRSFMPNTEEDGVLNPNRNDLDNSQVSDPVRRYSVYKKMHLDGKLDSNFYKLEVEEMKLIMKTMISDYEIEWFRDYIASRGGKYSHSWISYLIPFKFFNDKYYSEENKATWNNKYHFLEYGIPYKKYYAPQWLAFAEGTQCVGISNTSANAYNSMGIPAVTVSQPGHLAYAVMSMDANGNGSWQLYNSSFYWGESSHSITTFELANISQPVRQCPYNNRSLLGWGQQYSTGCSNLSYLAIAQEAVNDWNGHKESEKYVMAAKAYTSDVAKQEEMYRKAISAQKINVNAWWELVKLYANNSEYTEQDCLNLIKEFQTVYRARPLAFYDFFNMLIGKIKDPVLNAEAVSIRTSTLQWAELNGNSIHRGVAKILLGRPAEDLATFSFDGQYAGQIRLGSMFNEENQPRWEYSLDGGKTWTEPDGLYTQLTPSEILGINENNHIKVRVIGTEVNATIKITRNLTIGTIDVWANDDENALFLYNSNKKVEWRYSDDSSGAAAWKKYDEIKPTLVGNRKVDVRFAPSGTSLPSNFQNFTFTDNKYIAKETYIKANNLSIADVSSETSSTPAINAVDANFGTWKDALYVRDYSKWLSANDDENKFITIELKEPAYVSRLDYFPSDAQDHSTNQNKPKTGRIMQGEVLGSMDGETWTKLGDIANWANNSNTKTVKFANPQKVRYVKVVVIETNDGYVGARGFNLYEDTTQGGPPTAEITYSITSKTGKDVVATIGNFSSDTVVVEEGITTYTFTENGAYTFHLRDTATGRTNEIVASVDWIDRTVPTAGIQYVDLPNTKGYVQAKIVNIDKNVFILDENDRPLRYIEKTTRYMYEFNFDPETKQVINMVQKDLNGNITLVRGYKLLDPTKPISNLMENPDLNFSMQLGNTTDTEYRIEYTAIYSGGKITRQNVFNDNLMNITSTKTEEEIEELRQKYTTGVEEDILKYVFTKNGEKIYKLRDRIGNVAEIKMVVDWINRGPYIAEISYDKEGATNEDVTATLTFKEEGVRVTNLNEGAVEIENGAKYVFKDNGEFRFKMIDSEEVESYLDAKVTFIDKEAPNGIITYNTTNPTNGNVETTITFDKANVIVTNNEGSTTHTFTENGDFTFEFVDEAGNTNTAIATVDWIDRVTPTAELSYSTTDPTNQDVVVSIVDSSKYITITNNDGRDTYIFTENGEFTFEFVDEAGNTGTVTARVDWIDREEVIPTITYRINAPTGKDETAIITFNKNNVTVTNNNGKNTHKFEENGSFIFEFRDEAGNTGTATATVTWIDKVIPTAEVEYDTTDATNKSVTARLVNPSEEINITNNNGSDTYVFTKNGSFIFEFEDEAGNPGEVVAEVTWIDKDAPVATIEYSTIEPTTDEVIATLHLEDQNIVEENKTQTYTFTKNGEHTFEFQDILGNKGTIVAKVDWIFSGDLKTDIKYTKIDEGVIAELVNENREITVTNNGGNRTYLLTEEDSIFTFEYEDIFGNKGMKEAKFENMNGPATITYAITSSLTSVNGKPTVVVKMKATIDLPAGYEMKSNKSKTYTFSEKGSYVFTYIDSTTKKEYNATATVDWMPEASIEYSTQEPTKDSVDVIVHFNKEGEELTLMNDLSLKASVNDPYPLSYYIEKKEGALNTYTFKHNKSVTLQFSYQGVRVLQVPINITNIDEVEPVGTITYSNTEQTYRNVTATIDFNKSNVKILNNNGQNTYRFTENGSFTFEFEDEVGHRGTATANVDWILEDSGEVVPTIIYSSTKLTNKDVIATITFDQDEVKIVDDEGNEIPNGDKYTFTENGTHIFKYVDKTGRTGTATAEVTCIDKKVPEATITYSTTEKTNKPVTASITFDEENVTVEGGNTHTFEDSGEYTFNFVDRAGNKGTAVAKVDWIRKTLPNATITYSIANRLTCEDVVATISFDLEGVTVEGGNTHTFTENGEYTFNFVGPYGNSGSAKARVTWIDKVPPVATIRYNIENPTNQNVVATISFNKQNVTVVGGRTYTFTENGTHIFEYMDEAGNRGTATAEVDWIDKTLPIGTIEYSPAKPTEEGAKVSQDVTATISFNKENVTILNNEGSNVYTFTGNGEFEFDFVGPAGNRGSALARVDWIDKDVPRATISYDKTELTNEDVTATISFNKAGVTVEGGNTYTFTENGEHEFNFIGPSGNKGTAVAKVTWIDKKVPEATISYSTENLTNEDVIATISFDEENVTVEGGNTHTFTENGTYTFEYVDQAGNSGTKVAKVTWIDKDALIATVSYSTLEQTNGDVIATISFNKENVTVEGGNTHTFTKNGTYTFKYVDEAGNSGTAVAEVTWIDKDVPVATITYSTTNPTNQNVIATISFDKLGVTVEGGLTHVFTDNGEYTFKFVDSVGNTGTAVARVDWIDRKLPVATITYSTTNKTNRDVVATITFDKHNVEVEGGNTHTFTENGEYEFAFIGPAGNIGTAIARVTWIDKEVPVGSISYDITKPTNQGVIASISFNKDGVVITNNDRNNTYTFTENGEFTFEFIDEAGNIGTATATVTWIDKVLPVATITYSTENPTNEDVTASISFDKEGVEVEGGNTYTFTENGEHEFEFTGPAGNKGVAIAKVTWIDKKVPEATITYSTENPTNQAVTASISFDEEDVTVEGGSTYTFEENGEHEFNFVDRAGNAGTKVAKVDWIVKTLPNATFTYDITELTNQDVTVTVTFDREGTTVTNNDGNTTYTFTENGEFTFEFVGPYGNRGVATAIVNWIDKKVPKATISYDKTELTNEDVTATISFDKEGVEVEGGNTHIFTDSGEYTFKFTDKAGNKGEAIATVDWICKTLPNATITYSTTSLTNQDVIATITFDRENVIVLGGNTHRFTENGEYVFEFVGPYGNKGTAVAEVYWIDKVEPQATITYSTTNRTNQDVIATITFDKEGVIVEGGNTHTFTENGEYEFNFVGPAGNKGVAIATVTWIDKTLPVGTITYSTEEPTNGDVTASITFNKEDVVITNNNGSNEVTFTENGEFEFEFIGPAGNKGVAIAKVTWIDKKVPEAIISYSTLNPTNQGVIATISFDEEDVEVEGGNTYTFTDNGEHIFNFVDKAGNKGMKLAKVTWIDKTLPVGTITYSTEEPTKEDVIASITFDKEDVIVEGGNTHTFTENGEFEFRFVGPAGNVGVAVAKVDWIDKEPIEATVTYDITELTNKDVTASISFNKENVTITNNEGKDAYTFTENGEFEFTFIDLVGNEGAVTAKVDWINKKAPEATITYSTEESTSQPVLATIRFNDDDVTITNNDGMDSYVFEKNGEFTFEFVDSLGNKGTATATVTWIIEEKEEDKITSDVYNIKDEYITKIELGTTLKEFKEKVETVGEVVIKDKDQNIVTDDEVIKTGMTITVGETLEYSLVVAGDIDGNGRLTLTDLARAKLHYIGEKELTGIELQAADINCDEKVSITDIAGFRLAWINQ